MSSGIAVAPGGGAVPSPAPQTVTATATRTITPSPASTNSGSSSSSNTGPYLLAAAIVALVGVVISQVVQGYFTRKSNKLTQDSLDATRDIAEQTAKRAEADAQRADDAVLAQRYQDAAAQLGHVNAAVRLAGVHAMVRLADDWAEQRQACVSVLCGYLRVAPIAGDEAVREAVVKAFDRHLRPTATAESWTDLDYDLRSATFNNASFVGWIFDRAVDFRNAQFFGETNLSAVFKEGGTFSGCHISGRFRLDFESFKSLDMVDVRTSLSEEALLFIKHLEEGYEFRFSTTVADDYQWYRFLPEGAINQGVLVFLKFPEFLPPNVDFRFRDRNHSGRWEMNEYRSHDFDGILCDRSYEWVR